MTDKIEGVVVTLEKPMREDDAEAIINALKMVRGVIGAEPVRYDVETMVAYTRARHDLETRLWEALRKP